MTDKLWEEIGVEGPQKPKLPALPEPKEKLPVVHENKPIEEQRDEDFHLSRQTVVDMIEKGNQALDDLIFIARQDQSPRMYEVVATLIKTITESSKDLQLLHEKKQKIDSGLFHKKDPRKSDAEFEPSIQVTTDKAVFVGRNVELIDQLKEFNKKK